MEDAHTTILHLEPDGEKHISFFAVYDGHGGSYAAKYAGLNLFENLKDLTEVWEKGWLFNLLALIIST